MRSVLSVVFFVPAFCFFLTVGCRCVCPGSSGVCLLENGLEGWNCFMEQPDVSMEEVWSLDDGVLACRGTPRGYIYTKENYRDFTLTFQWRWPDGEKPGKGGVLFRMSGPHCIWPTSLEAQLNSGDAGDFWGLAGFALSGPRERMKTLEHDTLGRLVNVKKTENLEKEPGVWNTCEVIARGGEVVIRLNGEEVNRAHGCDLTEGPLCLTAEGNPIQFRNIRLKE